MFFFSPLKTVNESAFINLHLHRTTKQQEKKGFALRLRVVGVDPFLCESPFTFKKACDDNNKKKLL